ncbi:HVO_A0114 family putative DNA-binding protein [Paraburkholderia diazotrophica]|uniref:Predicted transcriptional regulator n=1 Tax=Paraburkholderia diazotrophica TaxID=667676 RepID=A0A1H6TRC8_9BURK|nr:transcriptional regulator [Paraburkholderia diazotrophica]SEI80744.1 Predicted transcriptional regulator [Paraburkholderia diazotrophica]
MTTVTICVESRDAMKAKFVAAMKGEAQGQFITFQSTSDLFRTMTPLRWELIAAMTGAGAMSIRELARRLDREQEQVHEDVRALLNVGVLDHAENEAVVFPYDVVHVDFTIEPKHVEEYRHR